MGFWVVEDATGIVKDYSADGSINYDPRFHTTRQDIDLPIGDQSQTYRWDGTKIIKQPPPTPSFFRALVISMGMTVAQMNTLLQKYPLFVPAVQGEDWLTVQALIQQAIQAADINLVQIQAIKQAIQQAQIPIILQ